LGAVDFDLLIADVRRATKSPIVDSIEADIQRAIVLKSFLAIAESNEPFHRVSFGKVPLTPEGPMFPELHHALIHHSVNAIVKLASALDEMQRDLVSHADEQEYVDALGTSRQYLHAAGYLARAADQLLTLATKLTR
jgi:hypothetical protein